MPRKTRSSAELPVRPVERWLTPVKNFLHVESSSGIVLLGCTVLALVLANSAWAADFAAIWHTHVELDIGRLKIAGDFGHLFINDGLMAVFFFVVGLEIKREIVAGELREPRKALLPVVAAVGGMLVPAGIYLALQWGQPGQRGWAIPMATDIAFVVGFLTLFGSRVPFGLKILLLTLAIVDDLGAVLVIATVFTSGIDWNWLGLAAGLLALTYGMNRAGVRSVGLYVIVGIGVWLAVLKSGVHPTVPGVLLGLMTPSDPWLTRDRFRKVTDRLWEPLREPEGDRRTAALDEIQFAARESQSPLHRLETALHPWVAFGIMPLFALANAGVPLKLSAAGDPVALAVAAGLALGKPLGILTFCFVAVKLGLTKLPDGVGWGLMTGGACLGGIGFTMSLFINGLAFPAGDYAAMATAGKVGTLLGSVISATLGAVILVAVLSARKRASGGA